MPLVAGLLVGAAMVVGCRGHGSLRRTRPSAPPAARSVAGVSAGVASAVAARVTGVPVFLIVMVSLALCASATMIRRRAQHTRRRARAGDAVAFCFAVAAELRAGRTPADALAAVASQLPAIGPEIAAAARACRRGASAPDELVVVGALPGCERLLPVAAAWGATATSGARAADVLDRIGSALADADAAQLELHAHVAGPQATVVVLALLPLLALGLGDAAGARPTTFLLQTSAGRLLLVVGAALDVAGVAWMRRIIRTALA